MLWLAPALLASALATTPPGNGGLLSAPDRRVRSTDPRIVELLEAGMQRSPTFAGLVKSVNATDVIVYIERVRELPDRSEEGFSSCPSPPASGISEFKCAATCRGRT